MNHQIQMPDQPPVIIRSHDHVAAVMGRAVTALPTRRTLEAVSAWHMTRFWSRLAADIKRPTHRRMAYVGT